jgi:hypothetical protein
MKNYFEIPELTFNQKQLQSVYENNRNEWAVYGTHKDKSLHTQYVSLDNDVIKNIIKQFKDQSIIENIKFFKTLSNGEVTPHTDKRNVAINIPIIVDDNSYTSFYEQKNNYETPTITVGNKTQDVNAKKFVKGQILETVYLKQALCLNTAVPHGVTNKGNKDRVILSISFKDDYDNFEIIKKLYDTGNLTRTK